MAPPRLDGGATDGALTVSNVMKEIQVLKDKFKNDDEDHCELCGDDGRGGGREEGEEGMGRLE